MELFEHSMVCLSYESSSRVWETVDENLSKLHNILFSVEIFTILRIWTFLAPGVPGVTGVF